MIVRREHSNDEEEVKVGNIATGDDMYYKEVVTFIDAIKSGDTSAIRSPYEDSVKTYTLTHAIRTKAAEPFPQ